MNEMDAYNRSGYRDYRNYDDMDNRNYRNYRNYRDDYRDDYRDYDRDYRNYREDYYGELEMLMEDMREQYRRLEDISEMASNQQDKNMLMKIAQKEKENMSYIKSLVEK